LPLISSLVAVQLGAGARAVTYRQLKLGINGALLEVIWKILFIIEVG
jgi:hypothetical protein